MRDSFLHRSLSFRGQEYRYAVHLPALYREGQDWPVILFLHGSAQRGSDGRKPTRQGLGPLLSKRPELYPAIVVLPQCPSGKGWNHDPLDAAVAALEETISTHGGDLARLYLTGASMGGYGAFGLAAREPERFAAVVPVCGGGKPETMAAPLANLPLWAFHGASDRVVPVEESRQMVRAIEAAGGTKLCYTEYAGVGHNCWDRAYREPVLIEWLFAQSKGG